MASQQELEQAITNVDKVVAAFGCDRQTRNIIEVGWQLIVKHAREAQQQVAPIKPKKPPVTPGSKP